MINNKFDWVKFHKNLDLASAVMIQEENVLLSNTSCMKFLNFVTKKKVQQGEAFIKDIRKEELEKLYIDLLDILKKHKSDSYIQKTEIQEAVDNFE